MPETLRWFYKSLEGMVTNLAVVSSDTPQTVRFADKEGFVFDSITFDNKVILKDELMRNGFTKALHADPYIQLFGLPSKITDKARNSRPIYSSGEHCVG